jgi:hypothetical protein
MDSVVALLDGEDSTESVLASIWLSAVQTLQRRPDLTRPRIGLLDRQVDGTPSDRLVEVGEGLVALAIAAYVGEEFTLVVKRLSWLRGSSSGRLTPTSSCSGMPLVAAHCWCRGDLTRPSHSPRRCRTELGPATTRWLTGCPRRR